jgi:hypothetical protein
MKRIYWGWILLGGFLAELLVFVIVIPLAFVAGRGSVSPHWKSGTAAP